MPPEGICLDHQIIMDLIEPQSSVLDLGCGTGELLYRLIKAKNVRGHGVEIDDQAIFACVAKGVNVLHGDIDSGLADYDDKSFDYLILNQSLQQVQHLEAVLKDALRVGKKVIVGFPNFAHYRARLRLAFAGKVPVTKSLPYQWYTTPNLHFLSIADFVDYCRSRHLRIERKIFASEHRIIRFLPNIFAQIGVFLISDGLATKP
jgi:methionine biosynthesis protein MetW